MRTHCSWCAWVLASYIFLVGAHRSEAQPAEMAVAAIAEATIGGALVSYVEQSVSMTNGLLGRYFNNRDLSGAALTRLDPTIDFDWENARPMTGINANNFSVIWTAEIEPLFSENYTFFIYDLDDGARLWINGQRIIDDWHLSTTHHLLSRDVLLTAGEKYTLMLHYFEGPGGASVRLKWRSISQAEEVIPEARLSLPLPGLNYPPNTPVISYPARDGDFVGGERWLAETDFFSDPNADGTHYQTEWELWTVDPSERVWSAVTSNTIDKLRVVAGDGTFQNSHLGRTNVIPNTFYFLRVRHVDNSAAASEWASRGFNTFQELPLVHMGTPWKYRDDGAHLDPVWRSPEFDDSQWLSGQPQFGHGGVDERTALRYGSNATNKHVTYYFRTSFLCDDLPAAVAGLRYRLLRADGAIVYLNGHEVIRTSMPQGEISGQTLAEVGAEFGDQDRLFVWNLPPTFLQTGSNTIAVEVHLSNRDSRDMSFYLDLTASSTSTRPETNIVLSNFDVSSDNWSIVRLNAGFSFMHVLTNGNPGGYLRFFDVGQGEPRYWKAPSKFLGNKCLAYGGYLEFDLKESRLQGSYQSEDVIIEGPLGQFSIKTPFNPDLRWTKYRVPLTESAGWRNGVHATNLTRNLMLQVLASITNMFIRGEYASANDDCSIDNVQIYAPLTNVSDEIRLLAQPPDTVAWEGFPVSFVVAAAGKPPLRYYWSVDDEVLAVTSANWITISRPLPSHVGSYHVIVSNAESQVVTAPWQLTVLPSLALTKHPISQTVQEGDPVEFTVEASGFSLGYQWQKSQGSGFFSNILGATTDRFVLTRARTNDVASYRVIVANGFISRTSDVATLTVTPDARAPALHSAVYKDSIGLILTFNETVLRDTATNVNDYTILNLCSGATKSVTNVTVAGSQVRVLFSAPLFSRAQYLVTVSSITDLAGNLIGPSNSVRVASEARMTLISPTNSWQWSDAGLDLGSLWRTGNLRSGFSGYGPGTLGRDSDGVPTCLGLHGTVLGLGARTYYFTTKFKGTNLSGLGNLTIRSVMDDGGILYLNGKEIFRYNMPFGEARYDAFAASVIDTAACITTMVSVSNLAEGENALAVEVHQANSGSEDIVLGLEIIGTVTLLPPTGPCDTNSPVLSCPNDTYTVTSAIDGEILWFAPAASDDRDGSTSIICMPPAGSRFPLGTTTITCESADTSGNASQCQFSVTVSSAPTVLVPKKSRWSFLDEGSTPSPTWTTIAYNDSSWQQGFAELGYGDGDEQTIVGYGDDPQNKHITTFFRRFFDLVPPADPTWTFIELQLKADDGAVVFLNGFELVRDNLPNGTLTSDTKATSPREDDFYRTFMLTNDVLQARSNLLAVAVHQHAGTSSDISFDLELSLYQHAPVLASAEHLLAVSREGQSLVVTWPASAGGALESASSLQTVEWNLVTAPMIQSNGQLRAVITTIERAEFFRLRRQ